MNQQIKNNTNKENNIFTKLHYKFIATGVALVFLGYLLMIGGKSADPNVFDESVIYGFRIITLSPIVIIAGFLVVCYGIMRKDKV